MTTATRKTPRRRLSKGQRLHIRRQKQAERKGTALPPPAVVTKRPPKNKA